MLSKYLKFFFIYNLCFWIRLIFNANFININNKNYSYIFSPGLTSTEMQLAKYLPRFKASTGEIISSDSGIHTINTPIDICKFAEINFEPLRNKKLSLLNPAKYLFYFFNNYSSEKFSVKIVNKENLKLAKTLTSYSILISKINIGQKEDVECLNKTYLEHLYKNKDTNVIIYGASRGAAAVFNFISKYKPKKIKAIILEGMFDSIHNLLIYKLGYFHYIIESLLTLLTSYEKNGLAPINSINKIPKNIPILLVASKSDESVPYTCTLNLYKSLKKNKHKNVYFLLLDNSSHVGYVCDEKKDKKKYETVVHAFYRKFNLPHDKYLAKKGEKDFKLCNLNF